jgi:nucleotide-binding universal stress UspA family protein
MVQIQKILCPIDFFPTSEAALSYAAAVAKNYAAKLRILHVIPPVRTVFDLGGHTGSVVKAAHEDAQRRLGEMAKRVKTSGVSVSVEVRFGEIDHEILEAADELKANLVVAGTHGRRGFEQWLLGSVCERLLRRVRVPILTIGRVKRLARVPNIKRVMIGIDFSGGSNEVVSYGFSIAQEFQANVTLIHAADLSLTDVADRYKLSLLDGIRLELQKLIPPEAPNWCDIATQVEFGVPYRSILKFADRENSDVIVLGTHGKSMLERTLLGSNAERVIRGAPCPVLAVPPVPEKKAGQATKSRL